MCYAVEPSFEVGFLPGVVGYDVVVVLDAAVFEAVEEGLGVWVVVDGAEGDGADYAVGGDGEEAL